jgi:hypothetical protein
MREEKWIILIVEPKEKRVLDDQINNLTRTQGLAEITPDVVAMGIEGIR